jgi:hypothetical protein
MHSLTETRGTRTQVWPHQRKSQRVIRLEEEERGYFVDASSISARLHHTKARKQDASTLFLSLGAQRIEQRRAKQERVGNFSQFISAS